MISYTVSKQQREAKVRLIKEEKNVRKSVTFHDTYVEVVTLTTGKTVTERTRYDVLARTRRELYDEYLKLGYVAESEL